MYVGVDRLFVEGGQIFFFFFCFLVPLTVCVEERWGGGTV